MSLPFKTLIKLNRKSSTAIYTQIGEHLINLISEGKLLPGSFLPSTREMAILLDIHRKTVVQAYETLEIQGWIEAIQRKGFQVTLDLPITKPRSFQPKNHFNVSNAILLEETVQIEPSPLKLGLAYPKDAILIDDGFPDLDISPIDQFLTQYRLILKKGETKALMLENNEGGQMHLRVATTKFINETRGLNINFENIITTRGAQMAIYLAAGLIIRPGDKGVVTEPNYFMANEIFKKMGAELYKVPVDEDGMVVSLLEEMLKNHDFKLLYIIPHHHHPTTVTMSPERRSALLKLIKAYDLWVIEDDYDYDFHYENSPILPLASAHHNGKIIYIGSFTKLLGAGYRIGYMVTDKKFILQAMEFRKLMDIRGDFMMEEALARLIESGEISRHINKSRKLYEERFNLTTKLLRQELNDVLDFTAPQGGMAIWLRFKEKYDLSKLVVEAAKKGVHFKSSQYSSSSGSTLNAIRFGFASLKPAEIQKAITIIKEITEKM